MNYLPVSILDIDNSCEKKTLAMLKGDSFTFMLERDGTYERHVTDLLKSVIKEKDYTVDLGANLGYHTITLSKLVGNEGRVFAFEPQRITFQQLNCNIFLNKLDNVYTFNMAAGEENAFAYIEQADYHKVVQGSFGCNIGNTSINLNSIGDRIPKVTLDSLNLPKLAFIKIDIQGSELLALMGAKNTILKYKPLMLVEIEGHHLIKFNTTPKMLIKHIKQMGYRMYQIKTDYPVDHLCIPADRPKIEFGFELREV